MNFLYVVIISSFLSSCELFGSGEDQVGNGEVVWRLENKEVLTVSTQPVIEKGQVFFIQDAHLKSYRLSDGTRRWDTQICKQGSDCDYSRTIAEAGDKLFIDQGFDIQAHSKADGSIIWEKEITTNAGEVSGIRSPLLSQDEAYLYAGRKGYVVKLRKSDGEIVHRYELDRLVPDGVIQGATEPVISPFDDNILYVPTSYYDRTIPGEEEFGANMFAFEANTGNLIWETRMEYAIPDPRTESLGDSIQVSPPIFDIEVTDSFIVALQGKAVVALNRQTGAIAWVNNFPDSGFDVGLSVENDGLYAASVGNFAYRLDLQTGEVMWQRDIKFANSSIPTVQNGRMYFNNSGGGGIWVLDTQDGSVIYNEPPPNHRNDSFDVYISSLGVGEGYMVNVGSKAVYCLTVP